VVLLECRRVILWALKRGDLGLGSGVCWSQRVLGAALECARRFTLGCSLRLTYCHTLVAFIGVIVRGRSLGFNGHVSGGV